MSQVHTEFLALSHFTHYLISSTQKHEEVDSIHSISPVRILQLGKLSVLPQNTPLASGRTQGDLVYVHWGRMEMTDQELALWGGAPPSYFPPKLGHNPSQPSLLLAELDPSGLHQ